MIEAVRALGEPNPPEDDDPDDGLPEQCRWLARLLRRAGAAFEDTSWPAYWRPWGWSSVPYRTGWDLNVVVDPYQFKFGPAWPCDRHDYPHSEQWQDYELHIGFVIVQLHRWWFKPRA